MPSGASLKTFPSPIVPHRPGVRVEDVDAFSNALVVSERAEAETLVRVLPLATGSDPWAGLIADRNGALRSTAHDGGANGDGVVFTLKP